MPLQSEIVQRLSADNSNFRSVMSQSEGVADKTGKSILKKLDLKSGMTAIAAAVGLNITNIAENFARIAIGFSREQEAALTELGNLTEQVAQKAIAANQSRLKTEDQLTLALKEKVRLQNALDNPGGRSVYERRVNAAKAELALRDQESKIVMLTAKVEEEAADKAEKALGNRKKIDEDIAAAKQQQLEYETKLASSAYEAQQKADEQHLAFIKENQEILTLEAKAKFGLTEDEAKRLKFLRDQTEELSRQAQIVTLLSLKNRTPEEEGLLQTLIRQSNTYKSSLNTVVAIADEIKDITPAIESNTKAWEAFKDSIRTTGRGDKELSDRELERKISNIQRELSISAGRELGTYQGAAGTGRSDFMTSQQRGAANQARAELDFRRKVRLEASAFGEDAAFAKNTGLSEQRFREILQTAPGTQDVVAELKKLNGQLSKGIPTVLFGTDGDGG